MGLRKRRWPVEKRVALREIEQRGGRARRVRRGEGRR